MAGRPNLLFGYDVNRDGVVGKSEQTAAGGNGSGPGGSGTNSNGLPGSGYETLPAPNLDNASGNGRGDVQLARPATPSEPNALASDGTARINVNATSTTMA